jgi:hypothetical protein
VPAAPSILGSTGSTTFVLATVLVACGLAMIVACLWLLRATRTDTPALGPLEVMGDRRFARRGEDARTSALTAARPEGAEGPAPMVEIEEEPAEAEPVVADPEPAAVEDEPVVVVDDPVVLADEPEVVEEEPADTAAEDAAAIDDDGSVDAAPRAN